MGEKYIEVLERASSFLESQGVEGYNSLFVFLERKQWTKTDWLVHLNEEMPLSEQEWLKKDIQLLSKNYPPQYLLGYSDFYGHRFFVTKDTLIPRPETEELVEQCLKENGSESLKVVDVGTGSGVIALSLKLARVTWQVTAIDISEKTLIVARKNAQHLSGNVRFLLGNILEPITEKVDIIISNPPYISEDEKKYIGENVQLYEPKIALFAENKGLAIYQKLAQEAKDCLKPDGKIYLEIGFRQGKAVQDIFQKAFPQKNTRVQKDLSGNDRMVIVSN